MTSLSLRHALLLTLLAAPRLRAADAVLQKAAGEVKVRASGERTTSRATAGAALLFGDEIRTGKASLAHVVFPDGAAVLVKENSRFTLKGTAGEVLVSFAIGEFLAGLPNRLLPGRSFRVRTPAAVAAVRGTLFWGKSDERGDTTYACLGHRIEVTARGKSVTLEPGESVHIRKGLPPQSPKAAGIPLSFLDSFSVDGSVEGLKELAEPAPRE